MVGVRVGVPPTAANEASNVGGNTFGISNPRNFKLINLQAILNSFTFILPSASVSASALKYKNSLVPNSIEAKKMSITIFVRAPKVVAAIAAKTPLPVRL